MQAISQRPVLMLVRSKPAISASSSVLPSIVVMAIGFHAAILHFKWDLFGPFHIKDLLRLHALLQQILILFHSRRTIISQAPQPFVRDMRTASYRSASSADVGEAVGCTYDSLTTKGVYFGSLRIHVLPLVSYLNLERLSSCGGRLFGFLYTLDRRSEVSTWLLMRLPYVPSHRIIANPACKTFLGSSPSNNKTWNIEYAAVLDSSPTSNNAWNMMKEIFQSGVKISRPKAIYSSKVASEDVQVKRDVMATSTDNA
ncbi:hypothetical protein M8C21_014048, partial [Ambrosia artemisiifolia]